MVKFLLTPCRVREMKAVPSGPQEQFDWTQAVGKFAPSGTVEAKSVLRRLPVNGYLGVKQDGTNFAFASLYRDNDLTWLVTEKPELVASLRCFYRIDSVELDVVLAEQTPSTPKVR